MSCAVSCLPEDEIVRSIVSAKIANQRAVLQRALRDYGEEMAADQRGKIDAVVDRLAQILRRVAFTNEGVDVLRGAEGEAAQNCFSIFGELIRSPDPEIRFSGRSRRPASACWRRSPCGAHNGRRSGCKDRPSSLG